MAQRSGSDDLGVNLTWPGTNRAAESDGEDVARPPASAATPPPPVAPDRRIRVKAGDGKAVGELRTEIAELRAEVAELRAEVAELRDA